jgi:hypothetical protein
MFLLLLAMRSDDFSLFFVCNMETSIAVFVTVLSSNYYRIILSINLSRYECAIIAGQPLHQTHNSLPTTLPKWLLHFIWDIRFRYFNCDVLTKCSVLYMGYSFRQLFKLWMMLKLVVQGNSHHYVQLKRQLDAIWKRAIFTLWPLYPRSLNFWYSLDRPRAGWAQAAVWL